MKIDKLDLGKALSRVQHAVNPKHGYFSHILIEADEEIRLTATNGNLFVRSNVDAGLIVEPGAILIDASKLGQLDRLNKPFDIEQDDKIAHIKCGRSKLKFPLIAADTFPRIDPPISEPWYKLNFFDAFDNVLFASAEANSGRSEFESVCIQQSKKGFILVSTNGYRISEYECEAPLLEFESSLLPSESLKAIQPILKESQEHEFWIESNQCKIKFDTTLITMRMIDGKFPDYSAIIPKNPPSVFYVQPSMMIDALKSITIAEGDKHCIGIQAEGEILHLWSFNGTYQASEEVQISGTLNPFKTGINSKFLIEALKHVKGTSIEIQFPNPASSCLITDTENQQHRQVIACMTPPPDLP